MAYGLVCGAHSTSMHQNGATYKPLIARRRSKTAKKDDGDRTGSFGLGRGGQALVELGEDDGPGLVVAEARFFAWEAGVSEAEARASVGGSEFDSDDGFDAFGGGGKPGEFDEAIGIEAEEAAVVGMALALEVGFEKESGVDFRLHHDRAGGGEPAVELFGPGTE